MSKFVLELTSSPSSSSLVTTSSSNALDSTHYLDPWQTTEGGSIHSATQRVRRKSSGNVDFSGSTVTQRPTVEDFKTRGKSLRDSGNLETYVKFQDVVEVPKLKTQAF